MCSTQSHVRFTPESGHCEDPPSHRRMLRQRDDARPAVPVAARALHVAQRNADRGLRVARLNAQVQIDHGVATVAGDDQPVMF